MMIFVFTIITISLFGSLPTTITAAPSEPTTEPTVIFESTSIPTVPATTTPLPDEPMPPRSTATPQLSTPTVVSPLPIEPDPTQEPDATPTTPPTVDPTAVPTTEPTEAPTIEPTAVATTEPTSVSSEPTDCDPQRDLWGKMRGLAHVEIGNRSQTCTYIVGGAIYTIPSGDPQDQDIDSQVWYDDVSAELTPGAKISLHLDIPDCAAVQQDAFWGEALKSLNGQRYGERLLAADRYHTGVCTETPVPPAPTASPVITPTVTPEQPTTGVPTSEPTSTPIAPTSVPPVSTATPNPPQVSQPRATVAPPTTTPSTPTDLPATATPEANSTPMPSATTMPPVSRPSRPPAQRWSTATPVIATSTAVPEVATATPTSGILLRVANEPVTVPQEKSKVVIAPAALPTTGGDELMLIGIVVCGLGALSIGGWLRRKC